ncbi:Diacylglycerol kinase gamma [Frankliniella fusca]|uniref:Diacylglycerol kinase gamma n=1 Tax=Frankliniella fusca TaxID=407009 RepID=A0AAE1LMM4_9NEOP|nr:Diacylglycerol kinase gamma [Frankliniella fusca]
MDHRSCSCRRALALALLVALLAAEGLARPQAPAAGKAPAGTTYDEIVVETHLAVRPKSPSVGVGLRRAKAVYFRPNATAPASRLPAAASSTTSSPSTSTSGDGISFAARVVGVENPLVTRARLAAAERSRRESSGTPGGYSSSSSSSSYSFKSSSSSKSSRSGPAEQAKPVVAVPVAPADPSSSSSSSSSSTRSSTWTLPGGKTVAVHEDSFSSQENDGKPSSSSVLRIIIGEH